MDTPLLIGLLVLVIVGFFAFQWWTSSSKKGISRKTGAASLVGAAATPELAAPITQAPPKEEKYPEVAGQTEQEMRTKEPIQRPTPPSAQQPVTHDGQGPAQFEENLRHPEQAFHQPTPQMTVSDVPAGRASMQSSPMGGNQQAFSPEMAQNGGALIGNSVFAYDGMEPVGFSSF